MHERGGNPELGPFPGRLQPPRPRHADLHRAHRSAELEGRSLSPPRRGGPVAERPGPGPRRTPGGRDPLRPAALPALPPDDPLGRLLLGAFLRPSAGRPAGRHGLPRRRHPQHDPDHVAPAGRQPGLVVPAKNKNFWPGRRLDIIRPSPERIANQDWGLQVEQAAPPLKWYQGLEKYCCVVLVISALGWLFDTMVQNLLNLVRKTSMEDLLMPKAERLALTGDAKVKFNDEVKVKGGIVTSIFLIGWAAGGFIF